MRTTPKSIPKKAKKAAKSGNASIGDNLLATMAHVQTKRHDSSISFVSIMKVRKMNDRNTPWRNEWRSLIANGLIRVASSAESDNNGIFTANYELTEKGEEYSCTPEQRELKNLIREKAKTTDEEHARIRKICMNNRTVQIFDLLLKHGSLTRKELAATIGISDRGAPFSYGLRQLKKLGFVVEDKKNSRHGRKKLILSEKAFVDPNDRPQITPIDPKTMAANIEKVYGKEMRKIAGKKQSRAKANPVVKQEPQHTRQTGAVKAEIE